MPFTAVFCRRLAVLVGCLCLGFAVPAAAERLDDAIRSYQNGYYQDALPVFAELATTGLARGQFWYGTMFYQGRGRPHNFREAMAWYRRAAAQGDADAQSNLGIMYRNGEGCVASKVVAFAWLSLAASQSNEFARRALEDLKDAMSPDLILQGQQMSEEMSTRRSERRPEPPRQAAPIPLRETRASPPSRTAAPLVEGYRVQIGIFRNRDNVAHISGTLIRERITADTDTVTIRGEPYYRVRTAVIPDADEAARMSRRVDALLGLESAVIPLRP